MWGLLQLQERERHTNTHTCALILSRLFCTPAFAATAMLMLLMLQL